MEINIGSDEEKLLKAISHEKIEEIEAILNNNKNVNLNARDKFNGSYPLLEAIYNDNIEILNVLVDYANRNNIILELNEKDLEFGEYPLLLAVNNNNVPMVKLILDYAHQHHINLIFNEKDNNFGDYPLLAATYRENMDIIRLLIDYAIHHNIIVELNEKNKDGNNPFLKAVNKNSTEIVKLLIDYSIQQNITLKFDESDFEDISKINTDIIDLLRYYKEKEEKKINESHSKPPETPKPPEQPKPSETPKQPEVPKQPEPPAPSEPSKPPPGEVMRNPDDLLMELFDSIIVNDTEKVDRLLDRKRARNGMVIQINRKDSEGFTPLYWATKNNNINIIKILMNYADFHHMTLKLNVQNHEGNYALLNAIFNNNMNIIKLLMAYSEANDILLNINMQNASKQYPLEVATSLNNVDMIKLLMGYANNNRIILDINQKDQRGIHLLDTIINNNRIDLLKLYMGYAKVKNIILNMKEQNIVKISPEIIDLLKTYNDKGNISIEYKDNSSLMKYFKPMNEPDKSKEVQIKQVVKEENNNFKKEEVKKEEGEIATMSSRKHLKFDLVNSIISKANIVEINDFKISPLILACYFNNEERVKELISQKVDVNIENNDGDTPLTIACYFNNKRIIEMLINSGANVDVKNKNGETPLSILQKFENNDEIIEILNNKNIIMKSLKEEEKSRSHRFIYFNKFENIVNNSVFQIEYFDERENKTCLGTGFLVKLKIPSEGPLCGLMTCHHILKSEDLLIPNFKFMIKFKNKNEEYEITLDPSYFVFSSKLLDITFIQFPGDLSQKLNINKESYLSPCSNDDKIDDNILIPLYTAVDDHPDNFLLAFSYGKIIASQGFDYIHSSLTDERSSGSPLINHNFEILGVHKERKEMGKNAHDQHANEDEDEDEDENENVATKFSIIEYAIRTLYINKSKIEMTKARCPPKTLTDEEVTELRKQGLQPKTSELFIIPEFDSCPVLYFYRSNHAWYWTHQLIKIEEGEGEGEGENYDLRTIKNSHWTVIKTIKEKDNTDYRDISHRQKIIMESLRLSELMYLTGYEN